MDKKVSVTTPPHPGIGPLPQTLTLQQCRRPYRYFKLLMLLYQII